MATDEHPPSEHRVAELQAENEELRSRLERLEKQQERAARAGKAAGTPDPAVE